MKITPEQLREAAQILYPQEFKDRPGAALVGALNFLHEAGFDFQRRPAAKIKRNDNKVFLPATEMTELREHLKTNAIHITAAARAIGVNSVTLYSWFHGNSKPRPENLAKIRGFLKESRQKG